MGESGHYTWYSEEDFAHTYSMPSDMDGAGKWLGIKHPRILFMTPEYPDYQADLLFHGLVKVLGRNRVVSHPYRAQYNTPEDFRPSPNLAIIHFQLGEQRRYTNDEIVWLVNHDAFDYVFLSRPYFPDENLNVIVQRLLLETKIEFVILDDDSILNDMDSMKHMVTRVLGGRVLAYFMKEIYKVYGAYPLQFAYPKDMMLATTEKVEQDLPFSFICKPVSTMRMEIAETLTPMTQEFPGSIVYVKDPPLEHDIYRDIVMRSKISINAKGTKFDCPRMYEIPMLGSMLMTHRLLIDQNKPFRDKKHCVYFLSIDELPSLLRYYLDDRREAERMEIAEQGRQHVIKHHTTEARAKQVLKVLNKLRAEANEF